MKGVITITPIRSRRKAAPHLRADPAEFEVALGQTVQIKLWEQGAHLFCATREQGQNPALEARLQPTNTGPLDLYRATRGRQSAQLPTCLCRARHGRQVAVSVAWCRIYSTLALIPPPPSQELGYFLLNDGLNAHLGLISNPPFQGLPGRYGQRRRLLTYVSSRRSSFPPGRLPGILWIFLSHGKFRVAFSLFPHLSNVAHFAVGWLEENRSK